MSKATGYQLSEIAGLVADLRDVLSAELRECVAREAPTLTRSEADEVIRLLREARLGDEDHQVRGRA